MVGASENSNAHKGPDRTGQARGGGGVALAKDQGTKREKREKGGDMQRSLCISGRPLSMALRKVKAYEGSGLGREALATLSTSVGKETKGYEHSRTLR